jgi:hypothetical protein
MFTLNNAPQSTCGRRVRFVLNAKQLPCYFGSPLTEKFPH